ncbi:Hypothetical predicted protein [Paramuricea clavata]|uniref:Uncharacterized protein n=1 Tax=Paramuricea clavata TaxID=317549 RepID=A0A6S7LMQ8_PARCT|nr:Hypothetical predicted protein [Paramuricea clavata]
MASKGEALNGLNRTSRTEGRFVQSMVRNRLQMILNVGSTGIESWSHPLLLYINDLPNSLKMSKPSMFADDTNLTCVGQTSSEIETKLNEELENVHRWLTANKFTLIKR